MTRAATPPTRTVRVGSGAGAYPVLIGDGLFEALPALLTRHVGAARFAVIADDNVAPLHAGRLVERCAAAGIDAALLTFPAGEASKSRERWGELTDAMLDRGMGRDACVVAVGGGVTTDLGGFVAATFMRGVPVVQVPTSYLAMIDASVGGKTGVDVRHGKNLVGAFHAPALVVADPTLLSTLPDAERAGGLVEAFKHGAILDAPYFDRLETGVAELLGAHPAAAREAVHRSVELKASVVAEDEREAAYRQILNFGHTVGHAVEAASAYRLGHGRAVALGMVVEAEMGEEIGVTEPGTADRLRAALSRLLGALPTASDPEAVRPYLGADKKARGGRARYVLLRRIGRVDPGSGWTHELPDELVMAALRRL